MDKLELIPIGSEITLDINKIKDKVSPKVLKKIYSNPNCIILDYKMTDGTGLGYVIRTKEDIKLWVFTYELSKETINKFNINSVSKLDQDHKQIQIFTKTITERVDISGNRSVISTINPLNMIKWLIYTTKDII